MLTGGRSLKAAPQPDADSGSDESSTPAPEACLGILPLELKARIVELAALQDERYRERWIPGAPGEKLVEVHKNAWRGRSLVALSQTSKEINELAARHLFYVSQGWYWAKSGIFGPDPSPPSPSPTRSPTRPTSPCVSCRTSRTTFDRVLSRL